MIRKICRRIRDYFELREVMSSIYEEMKKEVHRDPRITLGEAVQNLWADLDVSLVFTGEEHQSKMVDRFRRALDMLGIAETDNAPALNYLADTGRYRK